MFFQEHRLNRDQTDDSYRAWLGTESAFSNVPLPSADGSGTFENAYHIHITHIHIG